LMSLSRSLLARYPFDINSSPGPAGIFARA
jgi:hypothetical protein